MVRTRVGYAGGTTSDPTYRSMGDHTETVQIDFDPEAVSFAEIARLFWDEHDPSAAGWSTQYRNVIFFHDQAQKKVLEKMVRELEASGRPVATAVEPYAGFILAEGYHQKHSLAAYHEFMAHLRDVYPDLSQVVDSTAAARLNAVLGGYKLQNPSEIEELGLSDNLARLLRKVAIRGRGCPLPVPSG